jgi:hypothetical protein
LAFVCLFVIDRQRAMRAIREIGVKSDARSQEVRYIQRAYVPALYAASSLYEAAPGQVGVRTSHACCAV